MKTTSFGCKTLEQLLQLIYSRWENQTLESFYGELSHLIRRFHLKEPNILERLRGFKLIKAIIEHTKKNARTRPLPRPRFSAIGH